uniref:ShKT domain-containing protein n=1 Tax=Meloidogyne hapla TaxID=6305 RepID=A0A1I8BTS2_MELHA
MYPFGHSLRTYPQDVEELSNVALRAAQALQSTYGTKYTVGTGADTLSIVPTARETWEAVKVIGTSTIKQFQQPITSSQQIFNGIQTTTNNRAKRFCKDTDSLCLYWTQQSSSTCQQWPAMKERCSRSCGFCSINEEN